MSSKPYVWAASILASTFCVSSAGAEETTLEERLQRVEGILEANSESADSDESSSLSLPEWVQNFHLSGNGDVNYLYGSRNSIADEGRFAVDNARFFFDVDLGGESQIADHTVLRSAGFHFEWDLVREAELKNKAGALYVQLDHLFDLDAFSVRFGRFPLPFGEEYLRFHQQRPENPLISFSAPAPYNWDEGLLFFGSSDDSRFQYLLSVTDGDDDFNVNTNASPQVTAKLIAEPLPWLHASVSGTGMGKLGDDGSTGKSAIEWGGTHASPFGADGVPAFQDGELIGPDPSPKVKSLFAWEADLIFEKKGLGRLWLAAGQAYIESNTRSSFDRDFTYWIAEGILELGVLAECLDRFYAAVRYSGIGTLDSDEGYMFEAMNKGGELGFNTKRVDVVSGGIGVRIRDNVILKTEYSWFDFDLVRGVGKHARREARSKNYFGAGLTVDF